MEPADPPYRLSARTAALVREFQPDAREVEEQTPPFLARATLLLLVLLLAAAVAWAAFAVIDRVVTARGKLVTTAPTVVLQPLETSIIRELSVTPGQIVRRGDVIARLDPTFTEADRAALEARRATLAAEIERLEAEIAGRPYAPAPGAPAAATQLSVYRARLATYQAKLEGFAQQETQLRSTLAGTRKQEPILRARLDTLVEVEAIRNKLYQRETGSRLTLLDAHNARLQVQRDLEQAMAQIPELTAQLARVQAEREAYLQDWRRQAAEALAEAERDRAAVTAQLEKADRRHEMVALTAPGDAVVQEVAQRSVGSVVREAEPIATLVPLDVPLEVDVAIDARDIGHVRAGAPTRVKLDAFPFQKHGTLAGTIEALSEDSFTDDKASERRAFYRARVRLDGAGLRDLPAGARLVPGMTATAEIGAGERTVLSYFLYPIIRGLDESLREP